MQLSNPEKLMLLMLAEIQEQVGVKNGTNAKLLKEAIYPDNTWALDWDMPGVVDDNPEPTPPKVTAVCDILDMWMFIETAYSKLSKSDKELLEKEAGVFGKSPKFAGFDGNNETEYMSIAQFFVVQMRRFQHFQGRDFNSHSPTAARYTAMAKAFEPMRAHLGDRELSVKEIATLIKLERG